MNEETDHPGSERDQLEDLRNLPFPKSTGSGWDSKDVESALDHLTLSHRKEHDHRRETQDEILSRLDALEEHDDRMRELEEENEDLEERLERFQRSVPLPVYGALIAGLLLSGYGILYPVDVIYTIGGITIILISITAMIESKIRGNRIR